MANENNTIRLFNEFIEMFLTKKSFFSENEVFTEELLKSFNEIYVLGGLNNNELKEKEKNLKGTKEYDQLTSNFERKLFIQFNDADPFVKELLANIMWFYHLGTQLDSNTKLQQIKKWLSENFDEKKIPDGLAKYGILNQNKDRDFRFILILFYYLIKNNVVLDKVYSKTEEFILELRGLSIFLKGKRSNTIEEFLKSTSGQVFFSQMKDDILLKELENDSFYQSFEKNVPLSNILLYLCNKDKYESIVANSTKEKIAKNLSPIFLRNKWDGKNVDDTLQRIVNVIINPENKDFEKYRQCFSHSGERFFSEEIELLWKNDYVADTYEILTNYQKQVILYGAPGTGKTYNALKVIEEFLDTVGFDKNGLVVNDKVDFEKIKFSAFEKKDNSNENFDFDLSNNSGFQDTPVIWESVQFNQTYSYEDFIEGMMPKNGGIVFNDGIFKRIVNAAEKNPDTDFVMIIDEINRGKIDKIFGELLYLLEYRDSSVRLHYSGDDFKIPKNVYIIGTMNTADKSIAALDVALRRRFWFVKCKPKKDVLIEKFEVDIQEKISDNNEPDNVKRLAIKLFDFLNGTDVGEKKGAIENELINDFNELKIGHSYFLKLIEDAEKNPVKPTFQDLKNIWFYAILPLLEEYVGFDKERLSKMLKIKANNTDFDLSKKKDFSLENLSKKWN